MKYLIVVIGLFGTLLYAYKMELHPFCWAWGYTMLALQLPKDWPFNIK